jgi:hypothetical protein
MATLSPVCVSSAVAPITSSDARLVVYPIAAGETNDTLLTNWVFVHRAKIPSFMPLADWFSARR